MCKAAVKILGLITYKIKKLKLDFEYVFIYKYPH